MKKGALFKTVRVAAVLAIALGVMAALIVFRPEAERQVPPETGRLVEVMAVQPQAVTMTVESYGTVEPHKTLKLIAEVRGRVVELLPAFEAGGFVNENDVLVRIDPRDYQLDVESRNAQIRQTDAELKRLEQELRNLNTTIAIARNNVTLSRNDLERQRHLVEREVVAQSSVDKIEQQYLNNLERLQNLENQKALIEPRRELLRAQRQMTQVMLRQAALNLERTRILAPFQGWVIDKLVEVGQLVNVGQAVGTIYQAGGLEIVVRIPVRDLKWLPLPITEQRPLQAKVVFEAVGDRHSWPARAVRQKAQMDETTRTLPLIIEVADRKPEEGPPATVQLRPGMFVTVEIAGHTVERAFVLPRHLVYPDDVVYMAVGDRLHIRPVRVLRAYRDTVVIDEGLSDGDLVITTPLSSATEGMKIRQNHQQSS
jgi:RND family efflux transporter MFP subunit